MDTNKPTLKVILALFFVVTGLTHFLNQKFFVTIMPDWIPQAWHLPLVRGAGAAKIMLGLLLLVPATKRVAAWCLIVMLTCGTPIYLHVYYHPEILPDISPIFLFVRLPIQGLLIAWAYWYTGPEKEVGIAQMRLGRRIQPEGLAARP